MVNPINFLFGVELIAISADFDPVHKGHEKLIKEGRKLADEKQKASCIFK